MNSYFEKTFNKLEQQRAQIIEQLGKVSTEKFNYKPQPTKWSIAEILTHIITAEQLSLAYMKKKAPALNELDNSGFSESFRLIVLIISQRIPALKFKAPAVVVNSTPPSFQMEEAISKWNQQRQELRNFLESFDDKHVRKVLYKHPIAGRFDTRQALVFFGEHIIHHWPQIKRLLNKE